MNQINVWAITIFSVAAIYILLGFVTTTLILVAWNQIIPSVFKLPAINFSQAFGLFLFQLIIVGTYKLATQKEPIFKQTRL